MRSTAGPSATARPTPAPASRRPWPRSPRSAGRGPSSRRTWCWCRTSWRGIELVLRTLCEDAAVVVPTPAYPPFLDVVPLTGRALVPRAAVDPDGPAVLDLDRRRRRPGGGRPHRAAVPAAQPVGARRSTRGELEGLRDVVLRHGARVISDEVHAPLVLAGATHVPYATLEGTAAHTTTVLSAAKAWNLPGLRCAQVVTGTPATPHALRALPARRRPRPLAAGRGRRPRGVPARARRGWRSCGSGSTATAPSSASLVAELLPGVRQRPLEATYLAWLDVRALGHADPAGLALREGRVLVNDGRTVRPRWGRATSASTWPPRPSGWSASSGGWPRPGGGGRSDDSRRSPQSPPRRHTHHREAQPMRTLTVIEFLSLDGVMQAPGSPEEDTDGGFRHGGWQRPYFDEVLGASAAKGMASTGAYLFGRRTYEIMARHWPTAPADDPFTAHLNSTAKYVASTTLREVGWQHLVPPPRRRPDGGGPAQGAARREHRRPRQRHPRPDPDAARPGGRVLAHGVTARDRQRQRSCSGTPSRSGGCGWSTARPPRRGR